MVYDKLYEVQINIEETKHTFKDNIDKIIYRDERIDTLEQKTDDLVYHADTFQTNSNDIKRKMCSKRLKLFFCVVLCFALFLFIVIYNAKRN